MTRFDRLSLQYVAETLGATALFVASSFWAKDYLDTNASGFSTHVLVSGLATLPMLLVLWALVRYYRKVDERERLIMAVAGSITLLVGVLAALFLAKLEAVLTVDLNYFAAFLFVMWSVATAGVRWKM